jgi:hypothetical protein
LHTYASSGEIVALEQRDLTLTGIGAAHAQIKWWRGVKQINILKGCGDLDDTFTTDLSSYYVDFSTDGKCISKNQINWNWSDATGLVVLEKQTN